MSPEELWKPFLRLQVVPLIPEERRRQELLGLRFQGRPFPLFLLAL